MTVQDVLDQFAASKSATVETWTKEAAAAADSLGGDGAEMIRSYLASLPADVKAGTYGDEAAAVENNKTAVTQNLAGMAAPPSDLVPSPLGDAKTAVQAATTMTQLKTAVTGLIDALDPTS